MENNIFEMASRMKLRFTTSKGLITVEDLWDIPLNTGIVNLNQIAVNLDKLLKTESVSFVEERSEVNLENQLMFDIVKYIIKVRLEEKKEAKLAAKKREDRKKILSLIAEKEDNALSSKSIEELKAMLNEL